MLDKNRKVRENAYKIFYGEFDKHKNTISELYSGSVLRDKYLAEIRGYPSARAKALFPDNVPEKVYDNLIETVRNNLPALHDYYRLRAEKLNLADGLRHWDVYVSIVDSADMNHTWQEAVNTVCSALEPLGEEYVSVLRTGLEGRWADRYENRGKRSGAFSAGSYSGEPYILMNFKENVLRDVFTMAHEGGHSMHSMYSAANNPFSHYSYTIFEAEVASTFNEQLLTSKLLNGTDKPETKAYLIGKQIDDIIATIFRQTMFAEFERDIHDMAENGRPVTLSTIRETYRKLLEEYFGPKMIFEKESDLESLRIPHFYRAFYVYKYATGLSAAMALSEKVINGGTAERESYLNFLKSGGSQFPIDSLKQAGVDMSSPEPVNIALKKFAESVNKLQSLI
jgi:oligoendopeptidase F